MCEEEWYVVKEKIRNRGEIYKRFCYHLESSFSKSSLRLRRASSLKDSFHVCRSQMSQSGLQSEHRQLCVAVVRIVGRDYAPGQFTFSQAFTKVLVKCSKAREDTVIT